MRDPAYRPTIHDVITKFASTKTQVLNQLYAEEKADKATRERSLSVFTNVPRTPSHALPSARRDTIGEKYTSREPTSTRYSPGRYTPHLGPTPSFKLHQPQPQLQGPHNQLQQSASQQLPSQKTQPQQPHTPTTGVRNKSTPRDSPIDLLPDPPLELEFPEHEYFMSAPSQITPYLYLSSYNPSLDKTTLKHTLHITHIVNCTGSPNAYPDHFEYMHLKLHDEASQDILHVLQRVFDFIRDARLHKGKVLIFSDKVNC